MKHRHKNSDEFVVYLKGTGLVGAGGDLHVMPPMSFRRVAAGVEHFYVNDRGAEPAEMVGLYVGAASVPSSGYEFTGVVSPRDLRVARTRSLADAQYRVGLIDPQPKLQVLLDTKDRVAACAFFARWRSDQQRQVLLSPAVELIGYVAEGRAGIKARDTASELRPGHVFFSLGDESGTITLEPLPEVSIVGFLTGASTSDAAGIRAGSSVGG
jgi:hypothetical protein